MNNKSFLVSIAMIIMAGCVSEDDALLKTRVPISLTTSIAPTRATQDVQIGDGQEVYIWANEEEVSGTTNWDANNYIEAWHLTANATGGLTSANTYYYPTRPLSMVAIHGNFEFDEGKTQFPGVVSHTILADQSTAANLMKSDLLWWKGSGITSAGNPGGIPVTFAHNLSKIEITLSSDFYTADQLNAMEVSLCNVLPTVDLSLADGTTNAAHGTRITVTPLKPSASSPTFEAVIPAQARPDNFIVVCLDGGVVNVDAQVSEFDANTRYPYNLDITYRDVRKNPLWYVAEYNVNYDGSSTYSWATTPDEGYYFSWSDAMKAFTTAANASAASPTSISNYYLGTGCKFAGWHLPTLYEYNSIVPGRNSTGGGVNLSSVATNSGATYSETTYLSFGYNQETMGASGTYMAENSYWYKKSTNVIYAIRYCGSADYCSAWKYELVTNSGNAANPGRLIISATLLGRSLSTSDAATQFGTDNDKWESVYWGNNDSYGAVQRTFSGRGNNSTGNGATGDDRAGTTGFYWTSTKNSSSICYHGWFSTSDKQVGIGGSSGLGATIRLFKDNQKAFVLMADATASDVGKVICSEGHIHNTVGDVKCGGSAAAIIAYVGDYGTADYSAGSSHYKGLAIALTDANGGALLKWYTNANGTCITNGQNNNISVALVPTGDFGKGIDNTKRLATAACGAGHVHAAAQAAVNYENTMRHPKGASQWFIPTMYQWNLMLKAMCNSTTDLSDNANTNYQNTSFNQKIIAAGGTGVTSEAYWSSVECRTDDAWRMNFGTGFAGKYSHKNGTYPLRVIIAF